MGGLVDRLVDWAGLVVVDGGDERGSPCKQAPWVTSRPEPTKMRAAPPTPGHPRPPTPIHRLHPAQARHSPPALGPARVGVRLDLHRQDGPHGGGEGAEALLRGAPRQVPNEHHVRRRAWVEGGQGGAYVCGKDSVSKIEWGRWLRLGAVGSGWGPCIFTRPSLACVVEAAAGGVRKVRPSPPPRAARRPSKEARDGSWGRSGL